MLETDHQVVAIEELNTYRYRFSEIAYNFIKLAQRRITRRGIAPLIPMGRDFLLDPVIYEEFGMPIAGVIGPSQLDFAKGHVTIALQPWSLMSSDHFLINVLENEAIDLKNRTQLRFNFITSGNSSHDIRQAKTDMVIIDYDNCHYIKISASDQYFNIYSMSQEGTERRLFAGENLKEREFLIGVNGLIADVGGKLADRFDDRVVIR